MTTLPDTASPLYEKIKDYILTNIGTGRWSGDRKLPSENEFVAALGVSRMTVNRALRELTSAGFLIRIQGVGTFIAPPRPQSALIEINNIAAEIVERGNRHRAEVLALETITPGKELSLSFELAKRMPLYHSIVVHFENDVPVQVEERFVNPVLIADYDKQDFSKMATYDYLMQKTPATEVEHVISAVPADAKMASRLRLKPGECCLHLHRRTWTGAVVATISELTYAGSRYSLGSRYTLSKSG
jgi:GntR family histidine utilization transcriptional repressor